MALRKLTKREMEMVASPVGFARGMLGMQLYRKQEEALEKLAPAGSVVSMRSCNEGGKTSRVICAAILWHLWIFPKGRVISTSGSFRQIKDQLVPSLHRYRLMFPAWKFFKQPRIETPDVNCFWEGFSTSDGGKFEGHHEDEDAPLLIVVDEAKTVRDDIFQAIERCKPTRLLIASTPGYAEGEFYRSHTSRAGFYERVVQTAAECPHIERVWIEEMVRKWGHDHPLVRSMIWAEFMEEVADAIVTVRALEGALAEPPDEKRGERKAFCDFAAGGDENVLALRDGNLVELIDCWRERNTMAAVGKFISWFVRLGLRPGEIEGDADGLGKPMCDALAEAGWPITPFHGGRPSGSKDFFNQSSQVWWEGARLIEQKAFMLPDDPDLKAQLLSRKRRYDMRGRLAVETKDDMRRRGLPSPDRADAILGAMSPLSGLSINLVRRNDPWGREGEEWEEEPGLLAGMDAG